MIEVAIASFESMRQREGETEGIGAKAEGG